MPHKVHVLKTHPEPFADLRARRKTFEFRVDDREYEAGDTLWLEEFDPNADVQSGQVEVRIVPHLLRDCYGIPPGYVCMSLAEPTHEGFEQWAAQHQGGGRG